MTVKGVQEVLVVLEIVKIYAKNRKWKKKCSFALKIRLCLKWKRKKKKKTLLKMWWILKGIKAVKPLVLCWAPSRSFVTRSSLWLLQPSWLILLMPAETQMTLWVRVLSAWKPGVGPGGWELGTPGRRDQWASWLQSFGLPESLLVFVSKHIQKLKFIWECLCAYFCQ